MHPAISVRELTKTYGEGSARVCALRGVDLDVHPGELLMLVGPSGSGKTTLLSMMGCILSSTSGSIRVSGQEVTGLKQKQMAQVRLAHLGFVFQGFNLFPTLTAGENVELMLELKNVDTATGKKRAQQLLEQVGLADKYRLPFFAATKERFPRAPPGGGRLYWRTTGGAPFFHPRHKIKKMRARRGTGGGGCDPYPTLIEIEYPTPPIQNGKGPNSNLKFEPVPSVLFFAFPSRNDL